MATPLSRRARRSLLGIAAVLAIAIGGPASLRWWKGSQSTDVAPVLGNAAASPPTSLIAGETDRTTPQHTGRYSMLALGDSYTIGQSIPPAGRWPVQLAKRLREQGFDVTDPAILAHTGWTTADLLAAMDHTTFAPAYDQVLLLIGVNNQFRGQPLDVYRAQFTTLLQRSIALARHDPHRVVVLSIPDWGATPYGQNGNPPQTAIEIGQFNTAAQQLAVAVGAAFINITPLSEHAATQPALLAADGLHPSAQQYAQWVEFTLPAAKAALQEEPTSRP